MPEEFCDGIRKNHRYSGGFSKELIRYRGEIDE